MGGNVEGFAIGFLPAGEVNICSENYDVANSYVGVIIEGWDSPFNTSENFWKFGICQQLLAYTTAADVLRLQ